MLNEHMKDKVTIEPISALTTNMWKVRILEAAIKLDIFDQVQNTHELTDIAEELDLELDPLERLLNGLVAMELLQKKEDSYYNKPLSEKFLIKSSPQYYGDFVLMYRGMDDSWKELDNVIKTNSPVAGDNRERLARETFTRGMHNNAQAPANVLSTLIDFSDRKHLLDIGGGSGAFSIILTNKYEGLKATVNEQTHVCKTVREYVDKEGHKDKINILPGDYFKVEFLVHDVALFAQIFHTNSADENKFLLNKVHEKMEEDGMVIITEFIMDEDKTGPLFPALFSLNMLKQTKNGKAYTFSEIKSWLE
ncbi:MAG: methyltransferase, partial [Methanobacterium sp.]